MTRNLAYEWRRISSVRTTWILSAVAIVVAAVLAELTAIALQYVLNHPPDAAADQAAEVGKPASLGEFVVGAVSNPLAIAVVFVILSTIVAQAFGQEYRHGTIRLTLTAFPRRIPVFVSKAIVSIVLVAIVFAITVGLTIIIGLLNSGPVKTDIAGQSMWGPIGRMMLYLVGYCLIVFAVTVLTRVLALGIVIPLLFLIVIEAILVSLLARFVSWLPDVMPFTSALKFVGGGDDMLRNGLVFLAWVVALVAAALVVFRTRDA